MVALQAELGQRAEKAVTADPFRLPATPLIGGCFVAFARGEAGPGRPGDGAFAAAVVWELSNGANCSISPATLLIMSNTESASALSGFSRVRSSIPRNIAAMAYAVGRAGTTLVLKQGDKLEILATNRLEDKVDASPALVGNQLFLRGESHLYCIAE